MLSEIIEGWKNDLFPSEKLKDIIDKVYNERLSICINCKAYDNKGVGCSLPGTKPCCNRNIEIEKDMFGCGCPLKKKLKCLSCECPAKKWKAVITNKEEELINGKD